jgi:hypothetical protein
MPMLVVNNESMLECEAASAPMIVEGKPASRREGHALLLCRKAVKYLVGAEIA